MRSLGRGNLLRKLLSLFREMFYDRFSGLVMGGLIICKVKLINVDLN